MANALMDQLLKAGVVDKKQANRAKQQKRDKKKQGDGGHDQALAKEVAQQREAKAARDRELNQQRQREQEEKARLAQVHQLISDNRVSRKEGEIPYYFQHGDRIPSILVTAQIRDQLVRDQLCIVQFDEQYEVVPRVVAEKIRERVPDVVVEAQTREVSEDEARAYEEFPIPDDLVW